MLIYKQYSQSALYSQFNNRLHVPDFAYHLGQWELLSRQTEKELPVIKNIQYGSDPLETLDIYPSLSPASKILVFIHGGYWYKMDKSDFQFVAKGFHTRGVTTVIINYPLAPTVSLDQISNSCRLALHWIGNNLKNFNGDPKNIFIAGHSAGGHLAAMLMTLKENALRSGPGIVKGVCAISGLYNLIPIQLSDINQNLDMDMESALRNSPVRLLPAIKCPIKIVVGSDETNEFLDQSKELYEKWEKKIPSELIFIPGTNHYSILETMIDPSSLLHHTIGRLMKIY